MENDGHRAFTGSLLHIGETQNIASELIGQNKDIRKLFLSLTRFMDDRRAQAHCICLAKCVRYKLTHKQLLLEMMLNAYPSVGERRADLIADVLTQIRRMESAEAERRERVPEPTTPRR